MTKYEIIYNLKEVKLVIGNGFDLYCGMKTKYKDYFLSRKDKYSYINQWINEFHNAQSYVNFRINNRKDFWLELKGVDQINIWDLLFCILSNENKEIENWNWCDIESKIAEWLVDKNNDQQNCFNWKDVFNVNKAVNNVNVPEWIYVLTAFAIYKNSENQFKSLNEFYSYLLKQLNEFETDFGTYICKIIYPNNELTFNLRLTINRYSMNAKRCLDKLCNIDRLASLDTFNYDEPLLEDLDGKIHHINGNWEMPIFGVDTDLFDADDPRYIFTKTYRRMSLDMMSDENYERKPFSNIIVFGHSLNKADYNYFFSIFDKLNIVDLSNDSKIVFAYNVYDLNEEEQITSTIRKNISALFQEYSKYKSIASQHNRLLDELTIQGKVILYKVENLSPLGF